MLGQGYEIPVFPHVFTSVSYWIAAVLLQVPALCAQTPNGTYVLALTPIAGHEQAWPRRTMRLVMNDDTVAFAHLRDLTGFDVLIRGFPPNACFAVSVADSAFRWAHKARWTPGRADTVRVWVERSVDDDTEVRVAIDGESVGGVEIHSGGVLPADDGPVATVRGHRIGDADPQWCAQIQNAYIRTYQDPGTRHYLVGALTPRP
jgi:hypothetical protein